MGINKSSFYIFILLVSLANALFFSEPCYADDPVKIGVLAYRPKPQILLQWQPLVTALERAIPSKKFVIQALNYSELEAAATEGKIDFILTNSAHYVLLSNHVGLSYPLATLAANNDGRPLSVFGGVIFCRAGQTNIKDMRDLKGKKIAAPASFSLGGYQAQMYELSHADIHLPEDARMTFTDMPHDKVVEAVLAGVAEVGFVRTGVLESMVREGKLDLSEIKVLHPQYYNDFPLLLSTGLYPEWPFSSLRQTDKNLARQVAAALYLFESNAFDVQKLRIHGFVVPADYSPVINLLKELRLPPYEATPVFTLKDIWAKFHWHILSSFFAFGMIFILWFRLILSKRKLELQHTLLLKQSQELQESAEHIHLLMDSTAEGIYGMDAQGICTFVNQAALKILGYQEAHELVGGKIHKLIHHSHADGSHYPFKECRARQAFVHNQQVYVDNEVFWRKDGSCFQVEYWAFPFVNQGKSVGSVTTFFDITKRKEVELALEVSIRSVIERDNALAYISQGVIITSPDRLITYVNKGFENLTGYTSVELIGRTCKFLQGANTDLNTILNMSAAMNAQQVFRGVILNYRKDGTEFWNDLSIIPVFDKQNKLSQFVGVQHDITQHIRNQETIRKLAFFDSLTQLANRSLLYDRLNQAIVSSKRSDYYGALIFLDLDNFKPLNDSYGHDVGDHLLVEVAERLKRCIREADTAARFGGDEFVVLLTEINSDPDASVGHAHLIAKKILTTLSEPYQLVPEHKQGQARAQIEHHCSASIGLTLFLKDSLPRDEILRRADFAMYQAKQSGRNKICIFQEAIS